MGESAEAPFERSAAKRGWMREEAPVRFLQLRGLALARELGVDGSAINEMVGILCSALGADWLCNVAKDIPHGDVMPFRKHWIGDLVSVAGATQVAELLELTDYLRTAATSPSFAALMANLKDNYHTTILPLAFAHRFGRAGVTDLRYEPPARAGRRGDLRFSHDGAVYVVECYRPYVSNNELRWIGQFSIQLLDAVDPTADVVSIAVQLYRLPTLAERRELASLVGRLARKALTRQADLGSGMIAPEMEDTDLATVSVCPAEPTRDLQAPPVVRRPSSFPAKADNWVNFTRRLRGRMEVLTDTQVDIADADAMGLSHCAIWLPPEMESEKPEEKDVDAALLKLGRKIESKLSQARDDEGSLRVVIVNTWTARHIHRAAPMTLSRFRGKLFAHSDLAAVLLVHRAWTHARHRFEYAIYPIYGEAAHRLPEGLVDNIMAAESR